MKIPFFSRYTTDDQEFYDVQINEELKYIESNNFVIKFMKLNKNKRAFVIINSDEQKIVTPYNKNEYKKINETLEKIRLNLALLEKDNPGKQFIFTTKSNNKVKDNNGSELILSKLDDLLIEGEALKESKDIIERLINLAIVDNNGNPYLDFRQAGYDAGIQNYLSMKLYDQDIYLNDKLVNALAYFKIKKPKYHHLVNSFMLGNFDEVINYMKSIEEHIDISHIVLISRNIIQALDELPNRKYDLMIYRADLEPNHHNVVGLKKTYERFVSFGTSGGTLSKENENNLRPVIYKRILKKDDKAIPVDLIENLGLIYVDCTQENEFLLPSFNYEIISDESDELCDIYSIVATKELDPKVIFNKRLQEFEQYLIDKKETNKYDELMKCIKFAKKKAKTIIDEDNIKDIYYGLRPKVKK